MFFYKTRTPQYHNQLAFNHINHQRQHCIFIDLHFTLRKVATQTQIYTTLYIRYSRHHSYSLRYILQLYLCTGRTSCYKAECKEKQTLNRVLARNLILKRFAPFPTHCTSLSISRDSQRTEIRIIYYKTTNYAHFSKNKPTTF